MNEKLFMIPMNENSLENRISLLNKLLDSYRQENRYLKARMEHLETFVGKARGGFKIWYHFHHGGGIDSNGEHVESVTDRYIVAQNIASYEDAEQLLQMYESYNNNEYVTHIITSPAEGNDELPF